MTKQKPVSVPRPRGRPITRVIKLEATPEQAARAMFSAVKKPDPSLRKPSGNQPRNQCDTEPWLVRRIIPIHLKFQF